MISASLKHHQRISIYWAIIKTMTSKWTTCTEQETAVLNSKCYVYFTSLEISSLKKMLAWRRGNRHTKSSPIQELIAFRKGKSIFFNGITMIISTTHKGR